MAIIETNEQRIQFLLDFAYRDVAEMTRGDRFNLEDDFKAFLGFDVVRSSTEPIVIFGSAWTLDHVRKADVAWLRRLQKRIKDLFAPPPTSTGRGAPMQASKRRQNERRQKIEPFKFPQGYALLRDGGSTVIQILAFSGGGKVAEDEIITIASLTLATMDSDRLQLCPECEERFFWRVRRQKYCTPSCRQDANYQAWLARESNRDRKRAMDRERSRRK